MRSGRIRSSRFLEREPFPPTRTAFISLLLGDRSHIRHCIEEIRPGQNECRQENVPFATFLWGSAWLLSERQHGGALRAMG
jgi:hypothetical protein